MRPARIIRSTGTARCARFTATRIVPGIMAKRFPKPASLEDRWLLRVEKEGWGGCWRWIGATWAKGYGKFTIPVTQRRQGAHVWGYEFYVGPVPPGLELDHLCRNPWCVNYEHLEPVTHQENVRRGDARKNGGHNVAKTHCPQGHEYTKGNTYYRPNRPGRNCRTCGREVTRRRKAEKRDRDLQDSRGDYSR